MEEIDADLAAAAGDGDALEGHVLRVTVEERTRRPFAEADQRHRDHRREADALGGFLRQAEQERQGRESR